MTRASVCSSNPSVMSVSIKSIGLSPISAAWWNKHVAGVSPGNVLFSRITTRSFFVGLCVAVLVKTVNA